MAPLHSLCPDEVQHVCFSHVMSLALALSMVLMHSLGKDDQNEVQMDFWGHVTALAPALASYDSDSIANGTTAFLCT